MNYFGSIKKLNRVLSPIILLAVVIWANSCARWDLDILLFPRLVTAGVEVNPNSLTATLHGEIDGLTVDQLAVNHGHLWTNRIDDPLELPHPNRIEQGRGGNGPFSSELRNLGFGQNYFYRAYAQVDNEIYYGAIEAFSSPAAFLKIDTIVLDSNHLEVSVTLANLPIGLSIEEAGVTMSAAADPVIDQDLSAGQTALLALSSAMSIKVSIAAEITGDFYIRPYVIVNRQVSYGEAQIFRVGNRWILRSNFAGAPRTDAVAFSIGEIGYVGTGRDREGRYYKDFWAYDPQLDSWTQIVDFVGEARYDATGFSIAGKGYVGAGWSGEGNYLRDFWEYNPSNNGWAKKADVLGVGRSGAVGFSIDAKGYLGTGAGVEGKLQDFWEYDPLIDRWLPKADVPGGARSGAIGLTIADRGYIGLGENEGSNYNTDFWRYTPELDQWEKMPDFPGEKRINATALSIQGKGYVGTGIVGTFDRKKDMWEFDPNGNAWKLLPSFNGTAREGAISFGIADRGYIGLGSNGTWLPIEIWEYAPQ